MFFLFQILTLILTANAEAGVLERSFQRSFETLDSLNSKPHCEAKKDSTPACKQLEEAKSELGNSSESREAFDRKYELTLEACADEKFRFCYPDLKPAIPMPTLTEIFASLKKDPRFRYPAGGMGMCHYRAENLALLLAEKGIAAKQIRVTHSPTLIAMNRNSSGELTGDFDDYQGAHTLVQVLVEINGRTVPYFLDPQYMEEPMPVAKYFINTTGQPCEKARSNSEMTIEHDLTKCYYFEIKQNHFNSATNASGHFYKGEQGDPYYSCGWLRGSEMTSAHELGGQATFKKNNILRQTNGEIPSAFQNRIVSDQTSKQLILHAYENYAQKLQKDLDGQKYQLQQEQISIFRKPDQIKRINERIKAIEYSLTQADIALKRVQINLGATP